MCANRGNWNTLTETSQSQKVFRSWVWLHGTTAHHGRYSHSADSDRTAWVIEYEWKYKGVFSLTAQRCESVTEKQTCSNEACNQIKVPASFDGDRDKACGEGKHWLMLISPDHMCERSTNTFLWLCFGNRRFAVQTQEVLYRPEKVYCVILTQVADKHKLTWNIYPFWSEMRDKLQ